jgi:hypothetical protein
VSRYLETLLRDRAFGAINPANRDAPKRGHGMIVAAIARRSE